MTFFLDRWAKAWRFLEPKARFGLPEYWHHCQPLQMLAPQFGSAEVRDFAGQIVWSAACSILQKTHPHLLVSDVVNVRHHLRSRGPVTGRLEPRSEVQESLIEILV